VTASCQTRVLKATLSSRRRQALVRCRPLNVNAFLGLFLILSCGLSNAKTNPQSSSPTFHAGTELISVPVVVKDRYGNHVYGLTQNEFRVFENGHEVKIRSFDSVGMPPTSAKSISAPASPKMPLPQALEAPPVILFFDQLNTPADEQSEVRRQLALWYRDQETLAAPTCVILYTGSALRIEQQPTMQAAKIQAAIESIPTTVNSQGAGAAGELPLPAGAQENLPPMTAQFAELRQSARLDYFRRRATSANDSESALIYAGRLFAAWPK
jgi:VWFA-related protein